MFDSEGKTLCRTKQLRSPAGRLSFARALGLHTDPGDWVIQPLCLFCEELQEPVLAVLHRLHSPVQAAVCRLQSQPFGVQDTVKPPNNHGETGLFLTLLFVLHIFGCG